MTLSKTPLLWKNIFNRMVTKWLFWCEYFILFRLKANELQAYFLRLLFSDALMDAERGFKSGCCTLWFEMIDVKASFNEKRRFPVLNASLYWKSRRYSTKWNGSFALIIISTSGSWDDAGAAFIFCVGSDAGDFDNIDCRLFIWLGVKGVKELRS